MWYVYWISSDLVIKLSIVMCKYSNTSSHSCADSDAGAHRGLTISLKI